MNGIRAQPCGLPRNDDGPELWDGFRNTFGVVLAKARTHYPKSQLLRDAGAAIPFITECGGYGS
ncbi:hypothetical protein chiPu_0032234, partial [Chiloscyllium punctatum]|nr:hypothetical protein [Chiloscyllium punctatum]